MDKFDKLFEEIKNEKQREEMKKQIDKMENIESEKEYFEMGQELFEGLNDSIQGADKYTEEDKEIAQELTEVALGVLDDLIFLTTNEDNPAIGFMKAIYMDKLRETLEIFGLLITKGEIQSGN